MGFTPERASMEVTIECEHCGYEGSLTIEADSFCDGTFGVYDLPCPKCGETLEKEDY